MKRVLENAMRLASTPGMIGAYRDWILGSMFSNDGSSIRCTTESEIFGWPSFSEYWTFYYGIPSKEQLLAKNCLESAGLASTAFDVGANLGLFAVTLASLGYSQIHAFEPVPETFEKLKSNVDNNSFFDQVYLNCLAIGKEEGTAEFETFDKSPAINRMVNHQTSQAQPCSSSKKLLSVSVVSLDNYCLSHDIKTIDFMKIDVEGMEPLVIEGARKVFMEKRISVALIEICPGNLSEMGFSISRLNDLFSEIDYKPYRLDENGKVGDRLSLKDLESIRLENIVLLP